MRINLGKLFTREVVVSEEGVEGADLERPVTVIKDGQGNYDLADGNHRAARAVRNGRRTIKAEQIGEDVNGNVAEDGWRRPVKDLKILPRGGKESE